MREIRERRLKHRRLLKRLYSKTTAIILIIILLLLIDGTWKVFQKERASRSNLNRAQNQLASLNQRHDALSEDISHLKTSQGIENEIRSKYEVAKPGEQVLIIVDKNGATSTDDSGGVLKRWWEKFTGLFKRD